MRILATVPHVKRLSLNIDLGELEDEPEEFYLYATMVSIACGGHTGDTTSMQRALALAHRAGATVAAHPSYPDRAGFGRRSMSMSNVELERTLRGQMTALAALAKANSVTIAAVKPHGALYHDAAHSVEIAKTLLQAIASVFETRITLVGPPRGALFNLVTNDSYAREGFADRAYLPNGNLVPRSQPGALITNPSLVAAQAVRLARTGDFDTLCVHGDTPGAVDVARAVRLALEDANLLEEVA